VLRSLIHKDLILGQRMLALNSAIFTMYFGALLMLEHFRASGYAAIVGIMCGFLPVTVIARDDKFKANALTCSLPVTRSAVVLARYVQGIGLGFLGVVVAITVGVIAPWSLLDTAELLTGRTVMVAVTVVAITLALVLPLLQGFGFMGLVGLLIATNLFGVVVILATMVLGPANPLRQGTTAVIQAIETLAAWVHAGLNAPGFAVMWIILLGAMLTLSFGVARVLFARRDL
jgi:hypothetical protein